MLGIDETERRTDRTTRATGVARKATLCEVVPIASEGMLLGVPQPRAKAEASRCRQPHTPSCYRSPRPRALGTSVRCVTWKVVLGNATHCSADR
jgi:hypothetical protein